MTIGRTVHGRCLLLTFCLMLLLSSILLVAATSTCPGPPGQHPSHWWQVGVYNDHFHVVTDTNQLVSLPHRSNSNNSLPFQVDLGEAYPAQPLGGDNLQSNKSVLAFMFMRTPPIKQTPCNLDELELIWVLTTNNSGNNVTFAMLGYDLVEGRVENISTYKFIYNSRLFHLEKALEGPVVETELPLKLIPLWFVIERLPCMFGRIKIMLFYFQIDQHYRLGLIKRRAKIMKNLVLRKMTFNIETKMERAEYRLLLAFSPDHRSVYLTSDYAQLGPIEYVVPKFRPESTSGFLYRDRVYIVDTERQVVYTFRQPKVLEHKNPEHVFRFELDIFSLSDFVNCHEAPAVVNQTTTTTTMMMMGTGNVSRVAKRVSEHIATDTS